ncbi:MAG: hypothetical protein AB1540_06940 [Bdellovibrionota bacterium]
MKNFLDARALPLDLLDDNQERLSSLRHSELLFAACDQITQKQVDGSKLAAHAVLEAKAAALSASQTAALAKPEARVFSSKPTLKQMMDEYNKRDSRSILIKPNAAAKTNPSSSDFRAGGRVMKITIPNIPGKILRPNRRSDANN